MSACQQSKWIKLSTDANIQLTLYSFTFLKRIIENCKNILITVIKTSLLLCSMDGMSRDQKYSLDHAWAEMEESCLWAREWRNPVFWLWKISTDWFENQLWPSIRLSVCCGLRQGLCLDWTIESTSKNAPKRGQIKKHGVWDAMPELTITSPYVVSRVDSNTCTVHNGQPYARVDLNPMPKSTLSPSQDLGFGLRKWERSTDPSGKSLRICLPSFEKLAISLLDPIERDY